MLKILLVGNSPLPNENVKVRPAAGLRTWQFMRGLVAGGGSAGHGEVGGGTLEIGGRFEIKLVTIAMPECYDRNGLFEPKNKAKSLHVQTSVPQVGQFGKNSGDSKSVPGHTSAPEVRRFGGGGEQPLVADEQGGCFAEQLSKDDPNLLKKLQKIHNEFKPEVIIAVNTYPSFIASRLNSAAIFWADLNGWIMAEAQAQAHKMRSNDYLLHYTEMEESILRRADKFSVVSEAQKFAVLGELASIGRLCAESFGYEFCEVVRNGMGWFEGESNLQNAHVSMRISESGQDVKNSDESESAPGQTLDGGAVRTYDGDSDGSRAMAGTASDLFKSVPGNAFVLLWMGGYNTWVDEITLFKAVESAMQSCENLYFVSTGGEISGLDNKTFANFKLLIDGSAFKDRFVFLGWVDTKLIPYIYRRANVGLNVDKLCVETLTGARNRINEMMKFGLPVITTLGSEISYEVMRVGAGIGVASGRVDLLSEAIVKMWGEASGRGGAGGRAGDAGGSAGSVDFMSYGKNGQQYIEKFCNYAVTLKPLLKWLEHPVAAPDRGVVTSRGEFLPIGAMRSGLKYLQENGIGKFSKKLWQRIKM